MTVGVLVDLGAARVGAAGQAPDDGIVADDPARRVIQRPHDRVDRVRVVDLHRGGQSLDLIGVDEPRVDAGDAVDLGPIGHHEHRPVGVGQGQMAALGEEQVEVELLGEALVELDAGVVEARPLGRLVVGAQDRRVAPRGPGADVALLEDGDIVDAVLAQVVRGGQPVRAAADDDHVVGALELGRRRHMRRLRNRSRMAGLRGLGLDVAEAGERVGADRPPAKVMAGVGDHRPHVLGRRRAEQEQVALGRLAEQDGRLAGDRARAYGADRGALAAAGRAR